MRNRHPMRRDAQGEFRWRSGAQIRGHRANLKAGILQCRDGCTVELDVSTAIALDEILRQAAKTEDELEGK